MKMPRPLPVMVALALALSSAIGTMAGGAVYANTVRQVGLVATHAISATDGGWAETHSALPPSPIQVKVPPHFTPYLMLTNGTIVGVVEGGRDDAGLFPVDVEDITTAGHVAWAYPLPYPYRVGQPVTDGDRIMFTAWQESTAARGATATPYLVTLDLAGKVISQVSLATAFAGGNSLESQFEALTPNGLLLYVAHTSKNPTPPCQLEMVSLAGMVEWVKGLPECTANPVLNGDEAVWMGATGSGRSTVEGVSLSKGQTKWTEKLPGWTDTMFSAGSAVLVNVAPYLGAPHPYWDALEASTGKLLWQTHLLGYYAVPGLATASQFVTISGSSIQIRSITSDKLVGSVELPVTAGWPIAMSEHYVITGDYTTTWVVGIDGTKYLKAYPHRVTNLAPASTFNSGAARTVTDTGVLWTWPA